MKFRNSMYVPKLLLLKVEHFTYNLSVCCFHSLGFLNFCFDDLIM